MGFYLRKAIKVGPVRFNLSKSGVGVSTGIRGLRVGSGPRGNYIHMGRHGLYYRAALGGSQEVQPSTSPTDPPEPVGAFGGLSEIDSLPAASMTDSSAAELLAEFQKKGQSARWFPMVLFAGAVTTVVSVMAGPLVLLVAPVAIVATWWSRMRDELAKTVVLMYTLESEAESKFQDVHDAFAHLE